MKKRYQKCTWLEKRWRDRWLLWAPFSAVYGWLYGLCFVEPLDRECFLLHWDVSFGMVDCKEKRNYWYTMEECVCIEYLEERISKEELYKFFTEKRS